MQAESPNILLKGLANFWGRLKKGKKKLKKKIPQTPHPTLVFFYSTTGFVGVQRDGLGTLSF